MDLFTEEENKPWNLLPEGGTVLYFGKILEKKEATDFFEHLLKKIAWKQDEVVLFGKHIITKRKAAWYGDKPFSYTYSGKTKTALPWTEELLKLREIVEKKTGAAFNSCFLNLYHSGEEGMSWHSDNEKPLGRHPIIASISLGAKRKFSLKHKKTKHRISLELEDGSLLVMKDETQENWLHSIPKSKKVTEPRINLTFRQMMDQ